ncbi:MAG: UDP-N-acetylmuramate dehydrogenase [Spirochaetia bacterium]|nr:UDP-N-acetylmuramate dehydrogenase [Spirochaetia bacterium]
MEQKIQQNIALRPYTSIRTGGPARYFAQPADSEELKGLLGWANTKQIPVTILGGGSNTLIADRGIDHLVIDTKGIRGITVRGRLLCAACGDTLEKAVTVSAEYGLAGLEIFSGLPGTVGGAVYGNAGCYGHAVSEYIDWVEYLSCDGSLHRLYRDQYRFGYRDSPFKHHKWIITEVGFNLMPSQPIAIGQKAKKYRQMRRDKGHYRYPSMGSIFKNPPGTEGGRRISAGKLIEEAGLSGYAVGSARIADYHGNIIINYDGTATADDIRELIDHIRATVFEFHGIMLETEINFFGIWDTER